jgi:hypothetical protein
MDMTERNEQMAINKTGINQRPKKRDSTVDLDDGFNFEEPSNPKLGKGAYPNHQEVDLNQFDLFVIYKIGCKQAVDPKQRKGNFL